MKILIKLLIVLLPFGYGCIIQAQSTIPATGSDAAGTGGKVSYTVGQVVYSTIMTSEGSVTQGVQQPYEISVNTSVREDANINLICYVYPNPSTDFLILKIEAYDLQNMSFQLYGISGILLQNKSITDFETKILMHPLKPGTYFLKVSEAGMEIKKFKIIKN